MFARLASSGLLQIRPLRQLEHPREVIRQFTPNWFAVTMGIGILALALPQLPLPGMQLVGRTLWLINIGLFCLFMLLYAARWLFFFHITICNLQQWSLDLFEVSASHGHRVRF